VELQGKQSRPQPDDLVALLIDSGNTRLKWSTLTAAGLGEQRAAGRAEWRRAGLIDDLQVGVSRVLVANVAGEQFAIDLGEAIRRATGIEPEFVAVTDFAGGLRHAYRDSRRLGVDRWLAMIGARGMHPGTVCVVDVGTALTIDAVDPSGQHLGGLITPGPDLMITSLLTGTGDLAAFSAAASEYGAGLFANDTREAIHKGAGHALGALVDRCMDALRGQGGLDPCLLMTGGAAGSVREFVRAPAVEVTDLVLRGLAVLAND